MKDKNDKVRRKAVAALGEYMFYAATQLDDEAADPCWEIRDDAINAIIKSLRWTLPHLRGRTRLLCSML